jgi:membrane-bound lytic murein transglycosylase MltF
MRLRLQQRINNMKSCTHFEARTLTTTCVLLALLSACSTENDASGGTKQAAESIAASAPTAQSVANSSASTEVGQSTADDDQQSLSSLDELLPDALSELTQPWQGDLDGMVERRVIRVLVVGGGPMFFYHLGKPRGIVTEMLVELQKQINTKLKRRIDQVEIIPMPVSRDKLIPALVNGSADLVAADLSVTAERTALVDSSLPFAKNIDEVVVFAPGKGTNVRTIDDLAGQSVYVRESSSYFEHLGVLNEQFVARALEPIEIVKANEYLRPQDILEMLNAGLVSATVVDAYKANMWSQIFTNLQVRDDLAIHTDGQIAWFFRKDSPQLASVVNEFMAKNRAGTLMGNVLINRYTENLQWIRNSTSEVGYERLRPLLELFRASAEKNDFDTLMLVAQAYQESHLDNDKKSPAGAVGIMQIKPSTAADKQVGINDISSPADNIRAGARYMRFLTDRYFSEPEVDELHQWLFALAAYNAGPAKVRRMRNQAAAEGHDPNLWIDNVELVAAREIGRETVRYVRNVYKYYVAYRMSWDTQVMRESIDPVATASPVETGEPAPLPN